MVSLSYKTIMWILPDMLFLIAVLVTIVGVIMGFIITNLDVREGEANIAIHRLHFSPNGFSEYDTITKRLYPGMMDFSKLDTPRIESALGYDKNRIVMASKFWVRSTSGIPGTRGYGEAYLNKDKYENEWVVFAQLGERGVQGKTTSSYREVRQIVFKDRSLWLSSSMLMPK